MDTRIEVIGIDHGWSMMKSVSEVFVTGIKEMLLATDGVVANSFKNLIDSFFNRAAGTITG